MKNNNKKEYKKALNLYNNGYIDKAIEIRDIKKLRRFKLT